MSLQMIRILVIDDDVLFRQVIAEYLTSAGYEVSQADNGLSGINLFRTDPTDLVIIDIIMPEQEGMGTIIELRKDFPDVKIIAISGGAQAGGVDYLGFATKLGAVGALAKPFGEEQLLAAVREALGEE